MNLHDKIILELIKNKEQLGSVLEMNDCKIKSKLSLGEFGDIDLLVTGFDYTTLKDSLIVIEVKSHDGLIPHYKKIQLPKYIERYPAAQQYVVYSRTGKPNFNDLSFLKV